MKTISYDMKSLNRKTLELKKCPFCQTELSVSELEHSDDGRLFIERTNSPVVTTFGVQCPACGWWAVRERHLDHDMYNPLVSDIVVMADVLLEGARPSKGAVAWAEVVADKACWQGAEDIPAKEAVLLFGTAQMLLPNAEAFSKEAMLDKLKSMGPILFPIGVILLFALFS